MNKKDLLDILLKGSETWNKFREEELDKRTAVSDEMEFWEDDINSNPQFIDLSKANLTGAELGKANLSRVNLCNADLSNAKLFEANLSRAQLNNTNFRGANLCKANLTLADLSYANLSEAYLSEADLNGATLYKTDLSNSDLSLANIDGAYFSYTNLYKAILKEVISDSVFFNNSNLSEADISDTKFFLGAFTATDLSKANFSNADLGSIIFSECNLQKASFRGTDLVGTNFNRANLKDANLSYADLRLANLSQALLLNTNLSNTNLKDTNLSMADLSNANFSFAKFDNTVLTGSLMIKSVFNNTYFINTDLSKINEIDRCVFHGQCIIDYHTLKRSPRLTPYFLRGCGVSNSFINCFSSFFQKLTDYQSYFIRSSKIDAEFVLKLYSDLQKNGIRCWLIPDYIESTGKLRSFFYNVDNIYVKIITVMSQNSIKDHSMKEEMETFIEEERQFERRIFIPITIDKEITKMDDDIIDYLKNKSILQDFSSWNNKENYEKSLNHLLNVIKKEKPKEHHIYYYIHGEEYRKKLTKGLIDF